MDDYGELPTLKWFDTLKAEQNRQIAIKGILELVEEHAK